MSEPSSTRNSWPAAGRDKVYHVSVVASCPAVGRLAVSTWRLLHRLAEALSPRQIRTPAWFAPLPAHRVLGKTDCAGWDCRGAHVGLDELAACEGNVEERLGPGFSE